MLQHPRQAYMKQILQSLLQDAVLITLHQGDRQQGVCPMQAGLGLTKYSIQVHVLINL